MFKTLDFKHLAKFNSAVSSEFLDKYEAFVNDKLLAKASQPPHQTFAPSSFRCNRRSWFRLRGVEPDVPKKADWTLNFSAEVGTSCHETIQTNLRELLKDDWIDVAEFLETHPHRYECTVDRDERALETRVIIDRPPIRFACDGIVRLNDQHYLLEIKTSEFSSWDNLTDPKPEHVDQIKCYASLLNLDKALALYQDRQYGGLKCFEIDISNSEKEAVFERFEYVMDMVDKQLAPEGLPSGDKWCSPNSCPYYEKCKEYGRW